MNTSITTEELDRLELEARDTLPHYQRSKDISRRHIEAFNPEMGLRLVSRIRELESLFETACGDVDVARHERDNAELACEKAESCANPECDNRRQGLCSHCGTMTLP